MYDIELLDNFKYKIINITKVQTIKKDQYNKKIILVVALPSRLKYIKNVLEKYDFIYANILYIKPIIHTKLLPNSYLYQNNICKEYYDDYNNIIKRPTRGEIAVYISHVTTMKFFYEVFSYNYFIFFEDDILYESRAYLHDWLYKIFDFISSVDYDFDFINLGRCTGKKFCNNNNKNKNSDIKIFKDSANCLHSMIINKRVFLKLYPEIFPITYAIDQVINIQNQEQNKFQVRRLPNGKHHKKQFIYYSISPKLFSQNRRDLKSEIDDRKNQNVEMECQY